MIFNNCFAHLHVVSCVEGLQVKLPAGLGRPQTQVDAVARLEAGDGVVVRHSSHLRVRAGDGTQDRGTLSGAANKRLGLLEHRIKQLNASCRNRLT
jgi:hypothetical protein